MKKTSVLFLMTLFIFAPAFSFAQEPTIASVDQNTATSTSKSEKSRQGWVKNLLRSNKSEKINPKKFSEKPDLQCVQTAIDVREGDAINAFVAQNETIKQALEARRVALVNTYSIENKKEREVARRAAWDSFRATLRAANKTKATSQKTSWEKFRGAMKSCGTTVATEASVNEKLIPVSDSIETL